MANINASAAVGGGNSEAVRKSSNPSQQKTVWGKPLVGQTAADAAAQTAAAAPAKPAWGQVGQAVAPAESAAPKSAWSQPAPAAVAASDSKSSTPKSASVSVSPPPEEVDSESSKNLSAAPKPEDSSVVEKPTPAPPAAASKATVTSADTAANLKPTGLPATAVWAKPGSQGQPEETQTASAAAYVAPRAPWAKPEKSPEPVSITTAVTSTSENEQPASKAVEAATEHSAAKSEAAESSHAAGPDETDSAPAVVPDAADQTESAIASEKVATDLATSEAIAVASVEAAPVSEKPVEQVPAGTLADAGVKPSPPSSPKPTPRPDVVDVNSAEKKSPESPIQVPDSGKQKVVDEVTAVLTRLDLNSNKTDSVTSPGNASGGNSTTSSSKSGSMIKLKYEYKEGSRAFKF